MEENMELMEKVDNVYQRVMEKVTQIESPTVDDKIALLGATAAKTSVQVTAINIMLEMITGRMAGFY
jgi:hypothetical protein